MTCHVGGCAGHFELFVDSTYARVVADQPAFLTARLAPVRVHRPAGAWTA